MSEATIADELLLASLPVETREAIERLYANSQYSEQDLLEAEERAGDRYDAGRAEAFSEVRAEYERMDEPPTPEQLSTFLRWLTDQS